MRKTFHAVRKKNPSQDQFEATLRGAIDSIEPATTEEFLSALAQAVPNTYLELPDLDELSERSEEELRRLLADPSLEEIDW